MSDDDRRDRDRRERPSPPKVHESICDTCGKVEHECRRIVPGISGHTFVARRRLFVVEDTDTRP